VTDQPQTPEEPTAPAEASTAAGHPAPVADVQATPEAPAAPPPLEFGPAGAGSAAANERPEIPIAAAFGGGFVLAMILKRLAK
jgi:hypothetical protein